MVLYSWKKIKKEAEGKNSKILDIFYYIVYRPLPDRYKTRLQKYQVINWTGENFLVNPITFLDQTLNYTKKEMVEYLALSSCRSYAEYKATKTTHLDLLKVNVSEELINNNRLIRKEDNKIIFLFE